MTIIIIGGPRPNAQIFSSTTTPTTYLIVDNNEVLVVCEKLSHANALLPLIQSGE